MNNCEHLWFDHGQFSTCVKCCASNCEHMWEGCNSYKTCAKCFEVHPETKEAIGIAVAERLESMNVQPGSDLWEAAQRMLKKLLGEQS